METVEVRLPNLVEASEDEGAGDSAIITFLFVEEGEKIEEGNELVELRTDKASFTVPAPVAGTVIAIEVADADEVHVGDLLCSIEPE